MGERVLRQRDELVEVRLSLPNKHHFLVDLSPFELDNPGEVFFAADRPYGLIEGSVVRDGAPDAGTGLVVTMDFLRPSTLDEALAMKAEHPDAAPIAGGTDVMVELNFDARRPPALLDLGRVTELTEWSATNGHVRLGAAVPYTRIVTELARNAARAGDGVAHGRLAADPQPGHGRRQPRLGVTGRRRPPAAAHRGRRGRGRVGPRAPGPSRCASSSSAPSGPRWRRTS